LHNEELHTLYFSYSIEDQNILLCKDEIGHRSSTEKLSGKFHVELDFSIGIAA
jgi:hypothetical protein